MLNYLITLLNIKVENELQNNDLKIQMIVILDFIKDKFGFLTVEEIRQAFKMYVAKELGFKEIYRNLDTIVVSDVLNAYVDFRNESLHVYMSKKANLKLEEKNKLSEEEKDKLAISAVENFFNDYKKNRVISNPFFWVFDFLVEKGKLKIPNENTPKLASYYLKKHDEAKQILQDEFENKPAKSSKERDDIRKELKEIYSGNSTKIDLKIKELVLVDYFEKLISENTNTIFKDEIK